MGGVLLVLTLAPWYRLVGVRATGPSADQTLRLGEQYFGAHLAGLVLGSVLIVFLSWLVPQARLFGVWSRFRSWFLGVRVGALAVGLGVLAAVLSSGIATVTLARRPILPDGISQLIQARYLAAGMVAGPRLDDAEFWQFQFMVLGDADWVSQYPPGFAAVLALAWTSGAAWLVGPALLGVAVFFTTLAAERLFPDDRLVARVGAALMAVSPFLAFHAAAYMNHVLATALLALAVYASLRALSGSWRWALLSGAAVGALFATRPFVGLVLGVFATLFVWAGNPGRARFTRRDWAVRIGAAGGGAVPFAAAIMAYNARMFGSPTRFGYVAAAGPSHGLGFHLDPWGSPYGLWEAVGYTSADLLGMSLDLLQTPLPIVAVVALYLFRTEALDRGTRLVLGWALLPVAANAFYWHHDLFMGPRLLYEAAPGWCLLLSAASLGLIRALPPDATGGRLRDGLTRAGVAATFALALAVGIAVSGPAKLRGYAALAQRSGMASEAPSVERPTLVFVHEDWESRLGARMAAVGIRLDSIRAALLRNSTCEVERFTRARENDADGRPPPSFSPVLEFHEGGARLLRDLQMASGSRIRTYEGEILEPECEREAASDFEGVVALPPLLWQGDLPGLVSQGAMFVRDLGPERNARLLARFPDREPALLVRPGMGAPRLIPYRPGIEELWTVR